MTCGTPDPFTPLGYLPNDTKINSWYQNTLNTPLAPRLLESNDFVTTRTRCVGLRVRVAITSSYEDRDQKLEQFQVFVHSSCAQHEAVCFPLVGKAWCECDPPHPPLPRAAPRAAFPRGHTLPLRKKRGEPLCCPAGGGPLVVFEGV
jgi:hypothetical protein